MNKKICEGALKVNLLPDYDDAAIRSAFQKLQDWGIDKGLDSVLHMQTLDGGVKWQTSEWFTSQGNRKEMLETLICVFRLVAHYPHFIKDGVRYEMDTVTPLFVNEPIFAVSQYPDIYGPGVDSEYESLSLRGYLYAMTTALQQYVKLAEGPSYKRSFESFKKDIFLLLGTAGHYPEPSLTDKLHEPASYCIHPIEYVMFIIQTLREKGYFDALHRMMDVLYGSGRAESTEQSNGDDAKTVPYSM